MKKQRTKSQSIIDAESDLAAKLAALNAAKDSLKTAETQFAEARSALLQARIDADGSLPQCRMVMTSRYQQGDADAGRVVILRKTPTGILVVRLVGEEQGQMKFKFSKYSGIFLQAEKKSWIGGSTRELRDVPAEYMPK